MTAELTLFGLHLIGQGVSARGQRGREEIARRPRVVRDGEAGLPAPAAQRLVGEGALQRSPRRLRGGKKVDEKSSSQPNC